MIFRLGLLEDLSIFFLLSLAAGPFPFGEKGGREELVLLAGQPVDPLQGPPVGNHQQSQGGEGDVRAGEQSGQPAEREEERLSDENKDMLGPLLVQKQGKPPPDALLRPEAGVVDGYGFVFGFQDADEGLLLAQDSGGRTVSFFWASSQALLVRETGMEMSFSGSDEKKRYFSRWSRMKKNSMKPQLFYHWPRIGRKDRMARVSISFLAMIMMRDLGMSALPLKFLTPFPERFSRR